MSTAGSPATPEFVRGPGARPGGSGRGRVSPCWAPGGRVGKLRRGRRVPADSSPGTVPPSRLPFCPGGGGLGCPGGPGVALSPAAGPPR